MIIVKFDSNGMFFRQMNNLVEYSAGFLEGIEKGKPILFKRLSESTKELLESFIDVNARVNPESLHHVYEWYQTGSPAARLFDITCYTKSNGISFQYSFSQSRSVSNGSTEPFYDKANIMENGIPVTIVPKKSDRLAFDVNGKAVFTPGPVRVSNPGGDQVAGSFKQIFDMFFDRYFQQSFLQSANIRRIFGNMSFYKANLSAGLAAGRAPGVKAGLALMSSVRIDD